MGNKIGHLQTDQIATAQLAVDCEIEEGQTPEIDRKFEPGADGPDLFRKQRAFPAGQPPHVPRPAFRFDGGELDLDMRLLPCFLPTPSPRIVMNGGQ